VCIHPRTSSHFSVSTTLLLRLRGCRTPHRRAWPIHASTALRGRSQSRPSRTAPTSAPSAANARIRAGERPHSSAASAVVSQSPVSMSAIVPQEPAESKWWISERKRSELDVDLWLKWLHHAGEMATRAAEGSGRQVPNHSCSYPRPKCPVMPSCVLLAQGWVRQYNALDDDGLRRDGGAAQIDVRQCPGTSYCRTRR
jgi:hypothetical protein